LFAAFESDFPDRNKNFRTRQRTSCRLRVAQTEYSDNFLNELEMLYARKDSRERPGPGPRSSTAPSVFG